MQEALKKMNPERIATDIILKISGKSAEAGSPVYLSVPSVLSELSWSESGFESLMEKFLGHVLKICHPGRSIRVSIREKKRMSDLEKFFSLYPNYWLHLSIEGQSTKGFENGARQVLENLGYRCPEWVGLEGSEAQLGAFHSGTQVTPALILYVQNHGSRRTCDFLIPVLESPACFAHAI